jgi:cyclopropane fatty-acyl-phospholipid synthase-like methyltransferase
VARDLAAIRFHYDVGNNFYALWLDERLVYTCAYFETRETPLEEAQEAKLDLICRKLRLRPGMRLLDIGCGWGALVMFAAERYGVDATGITLSKAQADWATEEIDRRRLAGQARVLMRDYRDLGTFGHFDAVAAFGIIEHVGRNQLGPYFRLAFEAVRPGGLFLNHGIATAGAGGFVPSWLRVRRRRFVQRYIFPDSELVAVEDAIRFAGQAGFELLDVRAELGSRLLRRCQQGSHDENVVRRKTMPEVRLPENGVVRARPGRYLLRHLPAAPTPAGSGRDPAGHDNPGGVGLEDGATRTPRQGTSESLFQGIQAGAVREPGGDHLAAINRAIGESPCPDV